MTAKSPTKDTDMPGAAIPRSKPEPLALTTATAHADSGVVYQNPAPNASPPVGPTAGFRAVKIDRNKSA